MSVDRPPKSIVWKDRPKSRKVFKIRTVSTLHRTTKVQPPIKGATGTGIPQANDGDTEAAAEEEQVQPEPMNQPQVVQSLLPARRRLQRQWPYGSGLPGFEAYRIPGRDSSSEDHQKRTEHDDPTHPAPTSDAQDNPTPSTSVSKRYRKSHTVDLNQSEVESDGEPPELFKDGESSDDDHELQITSKISSDPKSREPYWHFDMCPDLSSSDSNPTTNERNEYYEWAMSNKEYTEWYLSTHPKPVDIREATRYWLNRRTQLHRRQHAAPGSYEEYRQ